MQALAKTWPDENRALFLQSVLQDPDKSPRGADWTALGKLHFEFGRLLRFCSRYAGESIAVISLKKDYAGIWEVVRNYQIKKGRMLSAI